MNISGSRVLLTGATGGLGRAIAKALDQRGAHLLLTGRKQDALEELARELRSAEALAADLAKRDDVTALPGRAGRVDVFVHNAGLPGSGRLESFTPDEIDRVLDVNLRAGIMLTHELLPAMTERGQGQLVYVSSMSGKIPTVRASIYAATKYGLRGFAGALRDDLHGTGVGVSTVFPGPIQGAGMWDDAGIELPRWVPTKSPEAVGKAVAKAIESNRPEIAVADPGQRAAAVLENVSARAGAWLRRRLPVEELADRTAEAQKVKR
ncbi:MAG TPA: SDR family NAD(P)-dependent oxidoreductase [Thermoleophilaceae bacterium]